MGSGIRSIRPALHMAAIGAVLAQLGIVGTKPAPLEPSASVPVNSVYGDYTAPPAAGLGDWIPGPSSGSLRWTYRMQVPSPAAGPTPAVSLMYDSQVTDQRTPASNNQAGQLGEGFQLSADSYISRTFVPCTTDGVPKSHDLCWNSGAANLVLNGLPTQLVQRPDGSYRLADDNDSRVVSDKGTANGTYDGDYWVLTTADGTQYYFGLNRLPGATAESPSTQSTWTVPVFGNDAGEPCHDPAGFASSGCAQAWRWNLDLVVDPHGNAETFWYRLETNYYNRDGRGAARYDRAGDLTRIDYGQRVDHLFRSDGSRAPAPERVMFDTSQRCTAGPSHCGAGPQGRQQYWPDVPTEALCGPSLTCAFSQSPTFFSTTMLGSIRTSVHVGRSYARSGSWRLHYAFVRPGEDNALHARVLWLSSVQHVGTYGPQVIKLPKVVFTPALRANRVATDGGSLLWRPRLSSVRTETGELLTFKMATGCPATRPRPAHNRSLCFPSYWTRPGDGEPSLDWFHKYVVTDVTEQDLINGVVSDTVETTYDYTHPGWHYAAAPDTKSQCTTWSQWRGFSKVTTTVGSDQAGNERSRTVDIYMQGMDGDRGDPDEVDVTGVDAPPLRDLNRLAGFHREHVVYDGVVSDSQGNDTVGPKLRDVYFDPWSSKTASQDFTAHEDYPAVTWNAWMVRVGQSTTTDYLTDPASQRQRVVSTTFNDDGLPTQVSDTGDTAESGDESCTTTWYARNASAWIVSLPARTQTFDLICTQAGSARYPKHASNAQDVVADTTVLYDGATDWSGQSPTEGDVTTRQRATGYDADGDPTGWQTTESDGYDNLGRQTSTKDADGNTTTTDYTPAGAGVPQAVAVTNALDQTTTTTLDPVWQTPTLVVDANNNHTQQIYDALGRLTAVWLPSNPSGAAYEKFDYHVNADTYTWVRTQLYNATSDSYNATVDYYNALGQPIQTQTYPANLTSPDDTGRMITETMYDDRGLVKEVKSDNYDPDHDPGQPAGAGDSGFVDLAQPVDYVTNDYDGAERLSSSFYSYNVSNDPQDGQNFLTYTLHTTYPANSVATSAPSGGSATQTFTDALGRTTEVRTYAGSDPSGAHRSTTYGYLPTGKLGTVTGPDGATTSFGYDLYGRRTSVDSPDAGTTTTTYTDLDQVKTTTDARGDTLRYAYDPLGRKSAEWAGAATPDNQIASWTYDQAAFGVGYPYQSTSFVGGANGDAYTEQVDSYDHLGQPTKTDLILPTDDVLVTSGTIPADGTLTHKYAYHTGDGALQETISPAAGGLDSHGLVTSYNASGQPDSYADVWSTVYTPEGQISGQTLTSDPDADNSAYLTNRYQDGTQRLYTSSVNDFINGLDADHTYTYDDAGNLLEDADDSTLPTGSAEYQCYRYDGYQRLTDAWTPADGDCTGGPGPMRSIGGAAPYWYGYSYTGGSQRATFTSHSSAGVTTTGYDYGATCTGSDQTAAHVLTGTTTTNPDGSQVAETYSCDASGDTTARPGTNGANSTQTLTWDQAGRLQQTHEDTHGSHPAYSTNYVYDADGNLLIRRTTSDGRVSSVLYDGDIEVDATSNPDGTQASASGRLFEYMNGREVGVQVGSQQTGQQLNYFVFPNSQGSVGLMLNHLDSSLPISKRYFDPFGNVLDQPADWPDQRTFLNKPTDPNGALTTLGARQYDPSIGAFITPDPKLDPSDPLSLNNYAYADGSPMTAFEPDGTRTCRAVADEHCW